MAVTKYIGLLIPKMIWSLDNTRMFIDWFYTHTAAPKGLLHNPLPLQQRYLFSTSCSISFKDLCWLCLVSEAAWKAFHGWLRWPEKVMLASIESSLAEVSSPVWGEIGRPSLFKIFISLSCRSCWGSQTAEIDAEFWPGSWHIYILCKGA